MSTSNAALGLLTGLLLGIAAAVGGFEYFILTAFLGVAGLLVGKVLDGEVDLSPYLTGRNRSRQDR